MNWQMCLCFAVGLWYPLAGLWIRHLNSDPDDRAPPCVVAAAWLLSPLLVGATAATAAAGVVLWALSLGAVAPPWQWTIPDA